jgi:hypothetical protein
VHFKIACLHISANDAEVPIYFETKSWPIFPKLFSATSADRVFADFSGFLHAKSRPEMGGEEGGVVPFDTIPPL